MQIKKAEWHLAFRFHEGKKLYENIQLLSCFTLIKNSWRYWCADPFLIEKDGTRYVFFELYDRLKRKGCIGYRILNADGSYTKIKKVYEDTCHLSYPNIFFEQGNYYIVPESSGGKSLYVLRAEKFPDVWKKEQILLDGSPLVDTTFLTYGKERFMFTTPIFKDNVSALSVVPILENGDFNKQSITNPIVCDKSRARMAGNFIKTKEKIIRVSQDCTVRYGGGLVFSEVTKLTQTEYEEKEICRLSQDLYVQGRRFDGIHTYASDDCVEFVDLKIEAKFNFVETIGFLLQKIKRIFKKN